LSIGDWLLATKTHENTISRFPDKWRRGQEDAAIARKYKIGYVTPLGFVL